MQAILLSFPMPIETPRLLLRPPQLGDASSLNAAILETYETGYWIRTSRSGAGLMTEAVELVLPNKPT